jgi:hypothetical protein
MRINDAIARADELRLNTISDEQKYTWVYELECSVCEMMGKEEPEKNFPEDIELSMPAAHEDVYVKHLCAKIDYFNGETELYANDSVIFDAAMAEARSWYIRKHGAKSYGNWRV